MHLVETPGPPLCILITVLKPPPHRIRDILAFDEVQVPRVPLEVPAVNMPCPFLTMQYQPEFEARIRHCDTNVALPCLKDGLWDMGMIINIKDAPYLIKIRCTLTSLRTLIGLDICLCSTDQTYWRKARFTPFQGNPFT